MLNLTDEQKSVFQQDGKHKEITIKFINDTTIRDITNDRIYTESLKLKEALCEDENIKFGSCVASELSIQVADVTEDIIGKEIQVNLAIENVSISLGIFYIADVEKAVDKRYKIIKAYDRMYYFQMDIANWYESLYPTLETYKTILEIRNSLFAYMGIEQVATTLPNDSITIGKTIDTNSLNGLEVIKAICEINGCFGHINRQGQFEYVFLEDNSLYPSTTLYPRNDLYPMSGDISLNGTMYIPPLEKTEYYVRKINKLQIHSDDDDIGVIIEDSNYTTENANCYIIVNNFLTYGQNAETLNLIGNNIVSHIFNVSYTPYKMKLVALPYMEVGDNFQVHSTKDNFFSYVLQREINGIQGMKDNWSASGNEKRNDVINGTNYEYYQLRSKMTKISKTVDGISAELTESLATIDGEITNLSTKIDVTASGLTSVVRSEQKVWDISTIPQDNRPIIYGFGVPLDEMSTHETMNKAYVDKNNGKWYIAGYDMNLGKFTWYYSGQLSELLTEMQSSISQNASNIELKVSKDGVISSINQSVEGITINANKINLAGYVTVSDLSGNGTTTINGSNITTGKVSATYIDGTNLRISGTDARVQIGTSATAIAEDNYISLAGTYNGVVYETGFKPQTFYTIDNQGHSMVMTPQSFGFNDNGTPTLNFARNNGVTYISGDNLALQLGTNFQIDGNMFYAAGNAFHDIVKIIQNNIILGNLVDYTM